MDIYTLIYSFYSAWVLSDLPRVLPHFQRCIYRIREADIIGRCLLHWSDHSLVRSCMGLSHIVVIYTVYIHPHDDSTLHAIEFEIPKQFRSLLRATVECKYRQEGTNTWRTYKIQRKMCMYEVMIQVV